MPDVTITPAFEHETRAGLALLPEAAEWPVELLVAKRGPALVGAAAVRWRNESNPPGFAIAVHVTANERRRGVGRRLVEAAADLCLGESPGLWSLNPIVEGTPQARFATVCGFTAARREHHFEADTEAVLGVVGPTVSRLRDRGKLPDDLKLVPLGDAPLDRVARLLAGGSTPGAGTIDRLTRYARDRDGVGDRSRIALRHGQVEGAIIWRRRGDVALVEMWAVHPRNRGWLSLVLLEDGLVRGRAEGLRTLRFHCEETVRDTMILAEQCGAKERETLAYVYRSLEQEDR